MGSLEQDPFRDSGDHTGEWIDRIELELGPAAGSEGHADVVTLEVYDNEVRATHERSFTEVAQAAGLVVVHETSSADDDESDIEQEVIPADVLAMINEGLRRIHGTKNRAS